MDSPPKCSFFFKKRHIEEKLFMSRNVLEARNLHFRGLKFQKIGTLTGTLGRLRRQLVMSAVCRDEYLTHIDSIYKLANRGVEGMLITHKKISVAQPLLVFAVYITTQP